MPTYYALTSPPGEGGISIIELFGPDACRIIRRMVRPVPELKTNRFYLGYIYGAGKSPGKIDQVIIRYTPAKQNFTGLDAVEINAHGGVMATRQILQALRYAGAKCITAERLIDISGRKKTGLDWIQKDALRELIKARTPLVAKVLVSQYQGALSKALVLISKLPARKRPEATARLIDSGRLGLALAQPRKIVIIGKPNAGKSTLFNALVGKDRALTHPEPGTTRDSIEELIAISGVPFRIVDTAGLRKRPGGVIERLGAGITKAEMSKADLILLVLDVTHGVDDRARPQPIPLLAVREKRVIAKLSRKGLIGVMPGKIPLSKTITVYNKIDLAGKSQIPNPKSQIDIPISALTGQGIDRLRKQILRHFGITPADLRYKPGRPVVFTPKQLQILTRIIGCDCPPRWIKERS